MPQDIPVEGKQLLAFTPDCLKQIEDAPVFMLRANTEREKMFHRRLIIESGMEFHDKDALREEVLNGLKAIWDEESFAEHSPVIKAFWEAQDEFELQRKDNPELEWSYDAEIEAAYDDMLRKITKNWPRLREMHADNDHYGRMSFPILAAVTIKTFTGLDVRKRIDRGYLTLDTIAAIREALDKFEQANDLPPGLAWMELCTACARRQKLMEEEEGNSASQSQSPTAPQPSTETAAPETNGKSPELELSTETPVTA